jgi:hypothetical protein
LALVAGVALVPTASATSASASCASYAGPPATWANFTQIKASGVSCVIAEKLIRQLYGPDYASHPVISVGSGAQRIAFEIKTQDKSWGYNLSLLGQGSKYHGDLVTSHVEVGPGLPDAIGHQVP